MSDPRTNLGFLTHIAEERYKVHAQPVFDLKTNTVIHEEWLVRFDTEINLLDVMRPAEISGAIAYLDIAMLNKAVELLNENRSRLSVAVNLSGASLDDADFKDGLNSALQAYTADPKRLIFELTETWDLRDTAAAFDIVTQLSKAGHPTCLDDVGAGAASIRYLRIFDVDWLKIDGDFIQDAMNSPKASAILGAIMSLRKALGVKFIAEGVETDAHVAFVKSMGFDAAQGFHLGHPRDIEL